MPGAKTVGLDVHAIATLRYIRASMDAAAGVVIPGSAGIVMGIVGLAATTLSYIPQWEAHRLWIWLGCAPLAAAAGALLLARSTSLLSFTATGTPGRKLALGLTPCLFAGAVMTAVLFSAQLLAPIPGTWLLLYGCALISASVSTTRLVAWMGVCFLLLGLTALVGPNNLQLPLLGVGFGGLHIVFGILIGREQHGRET